MKKQKLKLDKFRISRLNNLSHIIGGNPVNAPNPSDTYTCDTQTIPLPTRFTCAQLNENLHTFGVYDDGRYR